MGYTEKIKYQSNYWYNDGLRRANIRDMSGAIASLRKSLQYNRKNIEARNLLGLVYYGIGEVASALVEWIISKNLQPSDNIAEEYISEVQGGQNELDTMNQAIQKYNQSLTYCTQGNEDLAIIHLKKVILAHPTFLKAYQLLGLLYIHAEQYSKAKQTLRKARKLDNTDPLTLQYLQEVSQMRNQKVRTSPRKEKNQTITYNLGNETIIQPVTASARGLATRTGIIAIIAGILLGAAVVWFLLVPGVIQNQNEKTNRKELAFSEKIAAQDAELSAQKKMLDEYRTSSGESEAAAATAAATKDSYEQLLSVSTQYNAGTNSNAALADMLLTINRDSLGDSAQAMFDLLTAQIYPTVVDNVYYNGINALNVANYATAIEGLTKVVAMDQTYGDGDAQLYLGVAYARNGDAENAAKWFQQVIELFPDTEKAQRAQSGLDGNTDAASGASMQGTTDTTDETYYGDGTGTNTDGGTTGGYNQGYTQ